MARVEVTGRRYELPSIKGQGWGSFMITATMHFVGGTLGSVACQNL
ncbi:hypothetical protein [Brevibacillus brevis]|nr:hypothetical protein [Brevibacillus brevis]